ncbi:MAG: hypothetical protein QXE96_06925 [Candidatus Caldarchaeum sp.]
MAEPSLRTGAALLFAGFFIVLLGYVLSVLGHGVLWLVWWESVFMFDAGPALAAFGLGWIISALHPLRKWYLYSLILGVIISAAAFAASWSTPLDAENWVYQQLIMTLAWSVGPALILSATVASLVINRRVSKAGIVLQRNRHEDELDVVLILALYLPFITLVNSPNFYTRYVLPVAATWLIWHLFADRLSTWLLKRQRGAGAVLVAVEPPKTEETTIFNVASRSYYPMAFGLGVTTTVASILDLLGINLFGEDPFSATADAAFISIVAIALGSLYVGPVLWLFEDCGIRVFNPVRKFLTEPKIHSLADEMIEIYTFIFSPIGFTFSVADGDLVLAMILLAFIVHLLFTVSITSSYLYLKFSANKHVKKVVQRLEREGLLVQRPLL